jgi:ERCC4-type nuclease
MDYSWSKNEKQISKKIFDLALQRDYKRLIEKINTTKVQKADDIWDLQNFLNQKAKEFDEKYDYRYSKLILIFAQLINENLLSLEELEGLSSDKIDFIQKTIKY